MTPVLESSSPENCEANRAAGRTWLGRRITPWHGALTLGLATLLALPLGFANAQTAMAPNVKSDGPAAGNRPGNGDDSAASKAQKPAQPKAQYGKSQSRSGHRAATPSQKKAPAPTNAEPFVDTTEHASLQAAPISPANKQAALAYGQLASAFEPNQGQTNSEVKFLTRGRGFSLFLTPDGAVLSMSVPANPISSAKERTSDQLAMHLDGANENLQPIGVNELPGKTNYFIGKDRQNWRTNIPTYSDVKYKGVYPGVDLVYHGNQKELEYDFFVAPGANPQDIHLSVPGHALKIDSTGDLIIKTEAGEVRFRKPTIYELSASGSSNSNSKRPVNGGYVLLADNEVGFKLGAYDRAKTLVIDPVLVYSTLVGGSQHDEARGIAVDSTGAVYITGWTSSNDFPISAGAYNGTFTGGGNSNSDVFVTKLNPGGASIAYSTYIGGSEDDIANAIAIDTNGNAYVTGETYSPNFPTVSAYQSSCSSTCSSSLADAFLFVLGGDGSALLYSTYFGGNGIDRGFGVAVSGTNAYVYGQTIAAGQTENFPTTTGAYQTAYGGGNSDAFVAEFNTATSGTASLVYSTYLGGSGDEDFNGNSDSTRKGGIALDSSGDAWVTGFTTGGFPTVAGAYQSTFQGGGSVTNSDAFVTELNPAGTALLYSSYFGGSGDDLAYGIALDSSNNVYITGSTSSTNLPVTSTAFQPTCPTTCATNFNGFVTVLTPSGDPAALKYSTYLAGTNNGTSIQDGGQAITIDSSLNAYVTGGTAATNLVTTDPIQAANGGGTDAFVAELATSGTASTFPEIFSTYLGGSGDDFGQGIALDTTGNIYVAGYTNSTSTSPFFPTTPGAFQTGCGDLGTCNGKTDAFVAEINTANFSLTTTVTGSGSIASSPAGISCPGTCAFNFPTATVVTLTPTANSGFTFTGWTGACSGTGACSVTMNSDQTVGATFSAAFFLNVGEAGTGTGTVVDNTTPTPLLNCQPNCTANYAGGTVVTLTATPGPNSTFAGWSGACSGTGSCVVTMSQAQSVTATFNLTAAAASTCPATGTDNWTGGTASNWNNAANWSNGIPNSTTTNVCIANGTNGATVTMDLNSANVGTLFLGTNVTLSIENSFQFTINGNITNLGLIQIDSTGAGTWLNIAGSVTLTGGGQISLTNTNALLRRPAGTSVLTNVNNTISGLGDIGNNGLTLINQAAGVVNANSPSAILSIDAPSSVNSGLIEATNGGHLTVNVTFNNAGGNFTAGGSSTLELDNPANIQGGTLNGIGTLEGVGSTAQIDGSTQGPTTITGTFNIQNNAQVNFVGTINNTGTIAVASTGAGTWMNIVGPVMLTGGGSVTLSNTNALIRRPSGTSILTNVNNTIAGQGDIGNNSLTFINQSAGVVNANVALGTLSIDAASTTNQGLLEATNGGVLQISDTVENVGATVTAGPQSTVNLINPAVIEGGTITAAPGALFEGSNSTATLDGSSQGALTIVGTFTIVNNAQTNFIGTINNTGTIDIASTGAGTWMNIVGPVTLTGSGAVAMGNVNALIRRPSGTSILTNVNNTITGQGDIGNNGLTFINQAAGVVNANVALSTISIDAAGTTNHGLLEATNGGVLQISDTVENGGAAITAGTQSTVNLINPAVIEGGTITTAPGALFEGSNSTATLDGSSNGALTIVGTFTIVNNAQTNFVGTINNTGIIDIASTGAGTWMNIVGPVTLTGSGVVTMDNANALIRRPSGTSILTNVNNNISGLGDIGNNSLTFINQSAGVVNSNNSNGTLSIDAVSAVNQGVLESTGGGTLQISVPIVNAGATISATSGSTVNFVNGSQIEGGTISAATGGSPGMMVGVASTPVLDGSTQGTLTIAGTFQIQNNGQTNFMGTINNTGSIIVDSTGAGTWMNIVGTVTLTGGGSVSMTNANALIRRPGGTSVLINGNNTISGLGDIGNNSLSFTNQGTVNANDSGGGTLQIDATPFSNQGLLEKTGVGVLNVVQPLTNSGVIFPNGSPVPGAITETQTYTQVTGGSLDIAIGTVNATTLNSVLNVTGAATLAGNLNVSLFGGFTPANGNSFTVLTASSITGTFASINAPALPGGLAWSATYNPTSVVLNVSPGSSSDTLTVTELGTGNGTVSDPTGAITCTENNGMISAGSNCSASFSGGQITLTATPMGSPASTFAGWGGACASAGTSTTCNVTLTPTTNVTANFIAPPQSQTFNLTPGIDVVSTAAFNCPGNPNPITPTNPCTAAQGPNANAFEFSLPQVLQPFTMVVTATEFQADGLCPQGGSVTNPTDFDCRFATFFNYGTDTNGNTITPLCNPYANGNCVHYDIYYCVPQASGPCIPTPGQEPPPADYVNLVNLKITWNNDTFAPPSPTYTGSLPRLFDDPDYAFTPTSPYGTICGDPMVEGPVGSQTSEPYSCQFEFDVTTFFNPVEPVDAGIGGTIRQFNDLVVAFPPTSTGSNPIVTPPTPSAPTLSGSCVTGCSTNSNNVAFASGSGGVFQLTPTGYPAPTITETGALPAGLVFNTETGVLSGTPAAGTGGNYPITLSASNGVGSPAVENLVIVVDQTPAITSNNSTTFTVGTNGSFQVTATGFPAPTFSETGALPNNVTLSSTGLLSGTPATGTSGNYPITITATNGIGSGATQSFTLMVVAGSQAPAITSANHTTFTVGTNGSFQVVATGSPSPTFTETGSLPSNVTLSSTGLLSGVPAAGTGGTYTVTITASNGVLPNATQQFTLTVDQAPAITSTNSTTFTIGTNGSFQVTATGFPAPTFTETGSLPSNVTLSPSGLLSGVPAANTAASYPITITASNGVSPAATQTFTFVVVAASQGPVITSGNNTTFTVGTNGSFQVTATGSPAPTFSETGSLPSNVTLSSSGLLSGIPVAGTGGTYPITIKASNSAGSTTQSFTLTVDQPPAITSMNSTTFTVGTNGSFQVTATGFPAATFNETGSLPSNVTLSPSGLLSGTPAAGTNGSYPITITATNGVSPAAQQSFTLVVNPATTSTLTISPSSVNFGNVYAGTIGFRQVTLTNTGRSSITISNVQVTSGIQADIAISSSGNFIALSLCPRTLAAGKGCVVELTFFAKGSNYNPQSAELVITDSAPGSPQTVPLTATIINPQARLSANSISFSTQKVGTTSAAKSVTVTNTGTTNLVFNSINASGNFALDPATANACSTSVPVAPKASCVISVTFTPSAKGIRTGTLTLKDNVLLSPQVVVLTGIGN